MLAYLRNKTEDVWDDLGHYARKSVAHILGKSTIKAVDSGVAPLLLGTSAGLSTALFVAPASAAFSSFLVQRDYLHQRELLRERFAPEISTWLAEHKGIRKIPEAITDQDLVLASRDNATFKEALVQKKKERDWGIGISVTSSVASAAVFFWPPVKEALHEVGAAAANALGAPLLANPLFFLAAGVLGFAIYTPIKTGMHYVAEKMFGLEKETAADRIHDIRRDREYGRTISQEQVLGVVIDAQPGLDEMIKAEFGRKFEHLRARDRREVLQLIGPQMNLEYYTTAINRGEMRPEELAYARCGQVSGIDRKAAPELLQTKKEPLEQVWDKCEEVVGEALHVKREEKRRGDKPEYVKVSAESPDGNSRVQVEAYKREKPKSKAGFQHVLAERRGKEGALDFFEHAEQTVSFEATRS